jgi:hypothetical protein
MPGNIWSRKTYGSIADRLAGGGSRFVHGLQKRPRNILPIIVTLHDDVRSAFVSGTHRTAFSRLSLIVPRRFIANGTAHIRLTMSSSGHTLRRINGNNGPPLFEPRDGSETSGFRHGGGIMKRILRVPRILALLTVMLFANTASSYPPPGGGCGYQEPDHFCGLACRDYWCLTPSSQSMYCIEIPGGCGSMVNATCCPPY